MQVIVGLNTGQVLESDVVSKEQILKEENMSSEQFYDMLGRMTKMFKDWDRLDNITVQVNGVERHINPKFVMWVEVHGD